MKTKNSIRQYRPDGFENETLGFSTDEELINIPFVKNFNKDNFFCYAMSDNHLMAIYDNGFRWRVIGIIANPSLVYFERMPYPVKIQKWDGGKYKKEIKCKVSSIRTAYREKG